LNKDEKAAVIDRVAGQIEASDAILAVDYRGLSVTQASALRSSLREADATFQIVKNTLTERAADRVGAEHLKPFLVGPTALAFVRGDIAMAAKALARFRREAGLLEWKGGQMDGQPLTPDEIESIARLPAREMLHAQLVGTIASPVTGLVRGLGSMISGLAIQLEQIREQGLVGGSETGDGGTETAAPEQETAAAASEETAPEEAPADAAPAEEAAEEAASEAPGDPVAEGEAAQPEETSETSDTPSEGEGTEEG
jgi:large subunit ribosomal protein L10